MEVIADSIQVKEKTFIAILEFDHKYCFFNLKFNL